MERKIYGKSIDVGVAPAVVLWNPKYARNVGAVVRAASCWGIQQVWFTGNRIDQELGDGRRLPREERMRDYQSVKLINYDYPIDAFRNCTPVAIEVRENSENLANFEHPTNAVYVFGPEDGSLDKGILGLCHRFVIIPTNHCLNLAAAVNIVLYDRLLKEFQKGGPLPHFNSEHMFSCDMEG